MKNIKNTLILATLAGISIGIAGTLYLSLENKVVGALLFTLGLFMIVTGGFYLFTGRVGYALDNDFNYVISLVFTWLGNLLGTNLVAFLLSFTRVNEKLTAAASGIVATKMGDSMLSLFILGFFCNILMYVAVDGYKNNPHELGKYVGLFLGVSIFILCGFEHCIADMYYFGMAKAWNLDAFVRLIVITFGNVAGGLLIPVCKKCLTK